MGELSNDRQPLPQMSVVSFVDRVLFCRHFAALLILNVPLLVPDLLILIFAFCQYKLY